jgi:hypothetical protein
MPDKLKIYLNKTTFVPPFILKKKHFFPHCLPARPKYSATGQDPPAVGLAPGANLHVATGRRPMCPPPAKTPGRRRTCASAAIGPPSAPDQHTAALQEFPRCLTVFHGPSPLRSLTSISSPRYPAAVVDLQVTASSINPPKGAGRGGP